MLAGELVGGDLRGLVDGPYQGDTLLRPRLMALIRGGLILSMGVMALVPGGYLLSVGVMALVVDVTGCALGDGPHAVAGSMSRRLRGSEGEIGVELRARFRAFEGVRLVVRLQGFEQRLDLGENVAGGLRTGGMARPREVAIEFRVGLLDRGDRAVQPRSEEHTSELQSR